MVIKGAVIVCNHRTSVDPFFIQIVVNRYVRWMVAREYCEHPAFGWFLRATHAIPTNRRGNDTAATKLAIRSASQGELIGMFPEGHINHTNEFMLPGRPGAILVALKARVPILPCYIEGAPYAGTVISPFLMTARVRVRFGEPLDLAPYYSREQEPGILGELCLEAMSAGPAITTKALEAARNGNSPVLLTAYGGFNVPMTPGFDPQTAVGLENGAVVAGPVALDSPYDSFGVPAVAMAAATSPSWMSFILAPHSLISLMSCSCLGLFNTTTVRSRTFLPRLAAASRSSSLPSSKSPRPSAW